MPTQFPATIELSSLNGSNGFKINGIAFADRSGWSVAAAGDINADGVADLLIGAYWADPNGSTSGQSYVVFGGAGVASGGTFELSSLNGSNGFKLNGIAAADFSGFSVSAAGDINGDGVTDILIGAYQADPNGGNSGQSYVVFGGASVGATGTIELSNLNGANGFKINGIAVGDRSGFSVNAVGDISGDGVADLLIGAYGADPNGSASGQSYVVFGGACVGSSGTIELSNLNGANGFKLNGIAAADFSGFSVSAAGDINGDGVNDILIGAYQADPNGGNSGQSYLVFGGASVGSGGTIELSSLNGSNGFKLNGIALGDHSGRSVSQAGDVNNDGIADLLIGAYQADPNGSSSGQSYVVFGGASVGSGGTIELSSLNGPNGFKLNGIAASDDSGWSVAAAGDINADGVADLLIGAYQADPNGSSSGQSYVVFGDHVALVTNQLSLSQGQAVVLSTSNFNVTSINHPGSLLRFQIINTQQGQFEFVSNSGIPITSFFQQNVTDAQVQFVHNGSTNPPSYDVSALTGVLASTIPTAAIINFNLIPLLGNNTLTLSQGQAVILSNSELSATDTDNNDADLTFLINNLQYGQFEVITSPGIPITNFQQQNITDNNIQFVHDGSPNIPAYNVSVTDGLITTLPQVAIIDFNYVPQLISNTFTINKGQKIILTPVGLNATDVDSPDAALVFTSSNIQNGQFEEIANPGVAITTFTQQKIIDNTIQFVHDGSNNAPQYNITINDGTYTTPPAAVSMTYSNVNVAPAIGNNKLSLSQGQGIVLNSSDLDAIDTDNTDAGLVFSVANVQNGRFELISAPGIEVIQFTQYKLLIGAVKFIHDGSKLPPSYQITVSDSTKIDGAKTVSINFNIAPIIETNNLAIDKGDTVLLYPFNLRSSDDDSDDKALLLSTLDIQAGHFEHIDNPGTKINQFFQRDINLIKVQFIHDGSDLVPSYNVTVSDGLIDSPSNKAAIKWGPDFRGATPSQSGGNIERKALIGVGALIGVIGMTLICYINMGFLKRRHLRATGKQASEEQRKFFHEEVIPVAQEVFKQIKVTGVMNYISSNKMKAYVAEIATIITEINRLGINTEIQHMDAKQSTSLLNQIIKQMKHYLEINTDRCSGAWFGSFFKPQVTPEQISEKAQVIAQSVYNALLGGDEEKMIRLPEDIALPDLTGSWSQSDAVELDEVSVSSLSAQP